MYMFSFVLFSLIAINSLIAASPALHVEPSFDDPILSTQYVYENSIESSGLDTNETFKGLSFSDVLEHVKLIFPGTLWCGTGSKAKSYEELGGYEKTDNCCRGHDNCPTIILKGETRNGLVNNGKFTRSHCDCDHQFYECLKTASTTVSKSVGRTYFNFLQPQCFKLAHPRQCIQTVRGRCIDYRFDRTKPKKYQWFDNPSFK